ncbi:peptidoglycan-binding protein [Dactylosporangium sp. AC04546]|uniref:peptidoglycan-binding protein n=1 Tax=Dactylosporangium sp. AC04546 TaxID=2862460 RepID=UPI001EDF0074|nr:peptidoglycan-binding protein [Dactylosporangium sp. AC04546]WVK86633.1 peptidoglycan-binding protein [Dactylosporangium sp. AC04546]
MRTLVVSGVVLLLVGGGTAAALGFGGGKSATSASSTMPPSTAKVTRMTLTETADVDGTLGYGAETSVDSQGDGRITWLPVPGSTVERGKALYKVNEKPVVLLYGSVPMYRSLAPGVTGTDVKEFEQNLAALGYKGFTVDEKFNAATAAAVKAWQRVLGVAETGTVGPDAVTYAPGAVRVAEQKASTGAPAGGPVLTYTGTTRQVSIDLNLIYRSLANTGASVTVKLPDKSTVAGTVASIGRVADTKTSSDGKSTTTTVEVIVAIPDQDKLGSLDASPVAVTFVASQHQDVLTVPILALLALAEGGYGVQLVEGGTTRIVAVETGMFAGGRVEISGTGITADSVVGVPK